MGDDTFTANLKSKDSAYTVTDFKKIGDKSATILGKNVEASNFVKAGTYVQIGAHQYLLVDTAGVAATVHANATAIDNSIKDSFCLAKSKMFFVESNATIYQINATGLTSK